jgi:hypothetical protein
VEGGQKERRKRGVYKAQPKYMKAAAERAFWVCSYIGREEGSLFFFLFLFTPPPSFSIHETRYKGEERWEEYSIPPPSPKETNGKEKNTHLFCLFLFMCVCRIWTQEKKEKVSWIHNPIDPALTYKNFRSLPASVRQTLRCSSTPPSSPPVCGDDYCVFVKITSSNILFSGIVWWTFIPL